MLRRGWDILRSLQSNKKASVLRYSVLTEAKPHLGIDAVTELVSGLDDLDVLVANVSTREVMASRGKIELTDMLFVFYQDVKETDKILYDGKTYEVIQLKFSDATIPKTIVIARAA